MVKKIRVIRDFSALPLANNDQGVVSSLLEAEARWHYSQHYLAECRGEEVIENILQSTTSHRQRIILSAQLRDEVHHTQLFKKVVEKIGLDTRAGGYADAYANLVRKQRSLPEKIFVFQILTEAVSAGYCQWRLAAMDSDDFKLADDLVLEDEVRHLQMGKCMLAICDPDDIEMHLTTERKRQLVKEINEICVEYVKKRMVKSLMSGFDSSTQRLPVSSLDRSIIRMVAIESKKLDPNTHLSHLLAQYNLGGEYDIGV